MSRLEPICTVPMQQADTPAYSIIIIFTCTCMWKSNAVLHSIGFPHKCTHPPIYIRTLCGNPTMLWYTALDFHINVHTHAYTYSYVHACVTRINMYIGQLAHVNLVHITYAINEGSDEPVNPPSLPRAFAAHSKQMRDIYQGSRKN